MPPPSSSTPEQAIDPVEAVRKHVRHAGSLNGFSFKGVADHAKSVAGVGGVVCIIADLAVRLEQAERKLARQTELAAAAIDIINGTSRYNATSDQQERYFAALSAATRTEQDTAQKLTPDSSTRD